VSMRRTRPRYGARLARHQLPSSRRSPFPSRSQHVPDEGGQSGVVLGVQHTVEMRPGWAAGEVVPVLNVFESDAVVDVAEHYHTQLLDAHTRVTQLTSQCIRRSLLRTLSAATARTHHAHTRVHWRRPPRRWTPGWQVQERRSPSRCTCRSWRCKQPPRCVHYPVIHLPYHQATRRTSVKPCTVSLVAVAAETLACGVWCSATVR
jgi:hypothetical protein